VVLDSDVLSFDVAGFLEPLRKSGPAFRRGCGNALDPLRFGVETCRPTLEVIIDYCVCVKSSFRTKSRSMHFSMTLPVPWRREAR
jgi:hypothetical protein